MENEKGIKKKETKVTVAAEGLEKHLNVYYHLVPSSFSSRLGFFPCPRIKYIYKIHVQLYERRGNKLLLSWEFHFFALFWKKNKKTKLLALRRYKTHEIYILYTIKEKVYNFILYAERLALSKEKYFLFTFFFILSISIWFIYIYFFFWL